MIPASTTQSGTTRIFHKKSLRTKFVTSLLNVGGLGSVAMTAPPPPSQRQRTIPGDYADIDENLSDPDRERFEFFAIAIF